MTTSNQEVNLKNAVSMQNVVGIYERFSSTHYAKLREFNPNEAVAYLALFNPKEEESEAQIQSEEYLTEGEKKEIVENAIPHELDVITDPSLQNPRTMEEFADNNAENIEKEAHVQRLRAAGVKLASTKWGIDTLRNKVAALPKE